MKRALLTAAVPAAMLVFGFSGSSYAATAVCNFPAEPTEKTSDTKTYDIPCQLGTGDKEYQTMIISGASASFPPDIG